MIPFMFCYFIYYVIIKRIISHLMFMSMELKLFYALFSIIGLSENSVIGLWLFVYILFSILPFLVLAFAKSKSKSIIISSALFIIFVAVSILCDRGASNYIGTYNRGLWKDYPEARCLMLYDMKREFINQYSENEVIKELGNCDNKKCMDEVYYMRYYLDGYYYQKILLQIGFDKDTEKCVSVTWGLTN